MDKPLVSVVMPSYNHAEFIAEAIESVLRQTYDNFEFIIADDGSKDGTVEIIQRYQDPRIRFTAFSENTCFGTCEYIYTCARGDYIASICSDDVWDETLLEKYVIFLEEHQEFGCCFSKPAIINECGENVGGNSNFVLDNGSRAMWFKKLYMKGNCICGSTMCIRRSLFVQIAPFRMQYRQLQDYELYLRLLQIDNIYIYPETLAKYRLHTSGENHNMSKPTLDTSTRDLIERKYIMLDIMEKIDDNFFVEAFAEELALKPEMEGFCVECEKFGVMLKSVPCVPIEAAIFYYYRHYNDKVFRESIESVYHISRKDFWKLVGKNADEVFKLMDMVNKLMEIVKMKDAELERLRSIVNDINICT